MTRKSTPELERLWESHFRLAVQQRLDHYVESNRQAKVSMGHLTLWDFAQEIVDECEEAQE